MSLTRITRRILAALNLLDLSDTPSSYEGHASQYLRVKSDESGLEFAAGSGGSTTAANLPGGTGVFATKTGDTLNFKSIKGAGGLTITNDANTITLTAPAGGSAPTLTNVGAGEALYKPGTSYDFKTLRGSSGIGFTASVNELKLVDTLYFNVKNYGAIGDGLTDDSAAIQAAINACIAAGGGIVFFPAGSYLINTTLLVRKVDNAAVTYLDCPVTLVGAGRAATTLVRSPSLTGATVLFNGSIKYNTGLGIHNIGFKGNTTAVETQDYTNAHVAAWNCMGFSASNLLFREGSCDLYLLGIAGGSFHDIQSYRFYTPTSYANKHTVIIGAGINNCGDLFFSNCNFRVSDGYTNPTGPVAESTVLIKGVDGAWFTNCHLQGGNNTVFCDFRSGAGLPLGSIVGGVRFSNCWFDLMPVGSAENSVLFEGTGTSSTTIGDYLFEGCVFMGGTNINRGLFVSANGTRLSGLNINGCTFSGYRKFAANIQPGRDGSDNPRVDRVSITNCDAHSNWLVPGATTIRPVFNITDTNDATVSLNRINEPSLMFPSIKSYANVGVNFAGKVARGTCIGNTVKIRTNTDPDHPADNNGVYLGSSANIVTNGITSGGIDFLINRGD